ncbi:hypothetical protein [Methanolobus bombayensis]|uniref:hypothetical protein n=1 Tax=Methanolobus bombayensis TaxID=38023 RepID=UPI001AEA8B16|nr:hypothetical protein [Methanolobus bombayensis]MBP1909100.1 hypothetical protein [Methanolobus bombayensis]
MPEKENRNADEIDEDELDELFEQNIKKRREPKHRGYGNYERRRIYKGPSVKKE